MDLKETFNKGVSWVKAHPWAAAGILLLVILVAWWISKQAQNTSAAGSQEIASESPPDLGAGIGSSGGGLLDSFQSSLESPPSLGQTVGSASPVSMTPIPEIPMIETPSLFESGSIPEAFYQPPTQTLNRSLADLTSAGGGGGLGFFTGSVMDVMPNPAAVENDRAAKKSTGGGKLNDAQKAGKGKKFTGWLDGKYYYKGSLAAPTSIAAQTNLSPSTSASGNFFSGNVNLPGW